LGKIGLGKIGLAGAAVERPVTHEPPRLTPARRAEHAARDKRLAEALRENLRRRKEQARARDDKPTADEGAADAEEPRG
jgi:hypothetical protein